MALKNLFDMVKADKYTADGREELIKAQEAETEDKVYQIGEISQKTGLQKTANGWVKPKSGKQPGAKKPDESARIAASKEARAKKSQELGQKAAGDFAKYKDLPPVQRKDALGAASHEGISIGMTQRSMEGMGWDLIQADDKVNVYGKPDGSKAIMKHDGKKITEVSYEAPGNKPAAQEEIGKFYTKFKDAQSAYDAGRQTFPEGGYKIYNTPQGYKVVDDPKTQQRMEAAGYEVEVDVPEGTKPPKSPAEKKPAAESKPDKVGDFLKAYERGDFGKYQQNAEQRKVESFFKQNKDSAPSLSEIVDRVYNIGEISEKTGLQKTAQGWKPPKETKFGKVKQNKEGQWGVQVKQGKGSDFLKHKSEAEAKRALSNYTAGYNTTARSKEDPHSDKARQVKQWRKEDEKAAKARRAEGRAEHAAQFQNQPALSQTDGKGNKVEIKITESKGGGFYVDKYVNGKKVGINNANTRESAEAKAKSMMEQHMADPDYRAESKPAAGNNLPDIPDFKGMESGDYDNKLRAEGWTTGGWEGNGTHASAIFKKGDRTIRVNEGQPGKITSVQEISKPAAQEAQNKQKDEIWKDMKKREGALRAKGMTSRHFMDDPEYAHLSELYKNEMENDAAPRVLTGDTRIRVRKA